MRRWKDSHAQIYAEIRAERIKGTVAAPHLRLLAGGTHRQLPTGMIAKERLRLLFDQLRQDTDYVLVDTVPVSTAADASAVAAAADGVLLVVDRERARRRDLLAAKKQLANSRADVLGIVLNNSAVDFRPYVAHDERPRPGTRPRRQRVGLLLARGRLRLCRSCRSPADRERPGLRSTATGCLRTSVAIVAIRICRSRRVPKRLA